MVYDRPEKGAPVTFLFSLGGMKPSPLRVAHRHLISMDLSVALDRAQRGLNGEAIQIVRDFTPPSGGRELRRLKQEAIRLLDDASYGVTPQPAAISALERLVDHLGVR